MRLPIQSRLFYSHFLAVVLVSGSIGTFFYHSAVESLFGSLRSRLQYSAALLSRSVDARELLEITSARDVSSPAYQQHLAQLRDFQAANQDVAFIYVMRRDGETVTFVIDSDTSAQQALPGQPYTVGTPRLWEGFDRLAADDEVNRDAWGYFLSGYAPLKNGGGRFLIGIDMRADEVHRKLQAVRLAGVASLALSLVLAYLFSKLLAAHIVKPVKLLASRATDIAGGKLEGQVGFVAGDELGDLAAAFDTMSAGLRESQAKTAQTMAELERANATLEDRVLQRTFRLAEVNEELMAAAAQREQAQEALARAATTDYLTGLLNRPAVLVMIEKEVERARRHRQPSSLLIADLDGFKQVNDNLGHDVGDQVLIAVAARLQAAVRAQDTVARWGGDELLVLLPCTDQTGATLVAEKIRQAFASAPFVAEEHHVTMTVSLGGTAIDGGLASREVIRKADTALYQAKTLGRDRVVLLD